MPKKSALEQAGVVKFKSFKGEPSDVRVLLDRFKGYQDTVEQQLREDGVWVNAVWIKEYEDRDRELDSLATYDESLSEEVGHLKYLLVQPYGRGDFEFVIGPFDSSEEAIGWIGRAKKHPQPSNTPMYPHFVAGSRVIILFSGDFLIEGRALFHPSFFNS